jgi:hypothetical protein
MIFCGCNNFEEKSGVAFFFVSLLLLLLLYQRLFLRERTFVFRTSMNTSWVVKAIHVVDRQALKKEAKNEELSKFFGG